MPSFLTKRIKTIRTKLGYKQEYVALQLGITQQAYSYIETNNADYSINTVKRIADIFEVDYHFLINQDIPINDVTIDIFRKNKVSDYTMKFLEINFSMFKQQ